MGIMRGNRFFNINPTDMSDGSGRLYSIDTPDGERVASTTSEYAARDLRQRLNEVLTLWVERNGSDAVVNA